MVLVAAIAGLLIVAEYWRQGRLLRAPELAALAAPVLIFAVLYLFHAARVERFTYVDRPDGIGMFELRNVLAVLPRSASVLWRWTRELALPASLSFAPATFTRFPKTFSFAWTSSTQIANAAAALVCVGSLISAMSFRHLARMRAVLILLTGAILAYVWVICLGRGQADVFATTYYLYFFCLMAIVLLYALIDFRHVRAWIRAAAWLAAIVMLGFHAAGTRATTRQVERVNEQASAYLSGVAGFVDSHKADSGFSFSIPDANMDLDPEIPLVEGYPNDPGVVVRSPRMTAILFARYYDGQHPKYILDRQGKVTQSTGAAEKR
jgi:hypothetical protein